MKWGVSLFLRRKSLLRRPEVVGWVNLGVPYKPSPWLHLQTLTSVCLPFFFFSFFRCPALPPLSCPVQWGRILLVAMTSGQCLYEMQSVTVWTAGQDRDTTYRLKEELLSGTVGRGTPDPRLSDRLGSRGSKSNKWSSSGDTRWGDQHGRVEGGRSAFLTDLAWTCLCRGGSGEEKVGRVDIKRARQPATEWAAIHESDCRIRMVFLTLDMPLATTVSTANTAGEFCPPVPF